MKSFFKFLITGLLNYKAKQYLREHHTQVIAITGSIGKTSTKEAIYTVLKNKFSVYSSKKSFNTSLGLSLAILQEEESGFSSPIEWIKILNRVFRKPKTPYRKVVLEMGADKPGDIKKLMKIAPPKISVITNIANVHLAKGQFKNINEIAREKSTLIKYLPKDGVAVLNYDDSFIKEMPTDAKKLTYGVENGLIQAKDIHVTSKNIQFTVTYKDQSEKFTIPVLGKFQVYVFLPAIVVGLRFGMTLKECAEALSEFRLPAGRMNSISGINRTTIIDSSYNASPTTMGKALDLLDDLKANYKVAALGTMNELGEMSKDAHLELGKSASQVSDMVIAVGKEAAVIKQGAVEAGMSEDSVFTFFDSEEAGHFLKDKLTPRDLVLVKGSQNLVRMEKLVKIIMKQPEKASELLCRQGKAWQHI